MEPTTPQLPTDPTQNQPTSETPSPDQQVSVELRPDEASDVQMPSMESEESDANDNDTAPTPGNTTVPDLSGDTGSIGSPTPGTGVSPSSSNTEQPTPSPVPPVGSGPLPAMPPQPVGGEPMGPQLLPTPKPPRKSAMMVILLAVVVVILLVTVAVYAYLKTK